jgi:hypothetical protein
MCCPLREIRVLESVRRAQRAFPSSPAPATLEQDRFPPQQPTAGALGIFSVVYCWSPSKHGPMSKGGDFRPVAREHDCTERCPSISTTRSPDLSAFGKFLYLARLGPFERERQHVRLIASSTSVFRSDDRTSPVNSGDPTGTDSRQRAVGRRPFECRARRTRLHARAPRIRGWMANCRGVATAFEIAHKRSPASTH